MNQSFFIGVIVGVAIGLSASLIGISKSVEPTVIQCVDASSSAGTVMCLQPNNNIAIIPSSAREITIIDIIRSGE